MNNGTGYNGLADGDDPDRTGTISHFFLKLKVS